LSNKDSAVSFLKLASSGQVQAAYDRHAAPSFIHHNPYFAGDRQSLLNAMKEASERSPNKSFEVKRVIEEGDTVVTHSHVVRATPDDPGIAVVHIFRFAAGQIVELWDVGQLLSKDSPNRNGPF
jgi:predicted SnoaL-like aldol condensation-catalyzing enzyme